MGVDIYTLRKSKPINTQMGKVYRYEHKTRMAKHDYWCKRRNEFIDAYEEQAEKMSRIEDRFGALDDCLVCVSGHEGAVVYRQEVACPIWYDCNRLTGTPVGVLRKVGRRWVIADVESERSKVERWFTLFVSRHGVLVADSEGEHSTFSESLDDVKPGVNDAFNQLYWRYKELERQKEIHPDYFRRCRNGFEKIRPACDLITAVEGDGAVWR